MYTQDETEKSYYLLSLYTGAPNGQFVENCIIIPS